MYSASYKPDERGDYTIVPKAKGLPPDSSDSSMQHGKFTVGTAGTVLVSVTTDKNNYALGETVSIKTMITAGRSTINDVSLSSLEILTPSLKYPVVISTFESWGATVCDASANTSAGIIVEGKCYKTYKASYTPTESGDYTIVPKVNGLLDGSVVGTGKFTVVLPPDVRTADLIVESLKWTPEKVESLKWTPENPSVSTTDPYVYFKMTIKNIGKTSAKIVPGTRFEVYKQSGGTGLPGQYVVMNILVGGTTIGADGFILAPEETKTLEFKSTQKPNLRAEAGTFTLVGVADSGNLVSEFDEANNEYKTEITISGETKVPYADLAVESIRIEQESSIELQQPPRATEDRFVRFYGTIRNRGTATSDRYDTELYVDDKPINGANGWASLKPEASFVADHGSIRFAPGWHTAKIVVKPYGEDYNDDNNALEEKFFVGESPVCKKPCVQSGDTCVCPAVEKVPPICRQGSNGEGWYEEEKLITNDVCTCYAVCREVTDVLYPSETSTAPGGGPAEIAGSVIVPKPTSSYGWYSSCTGRLISYAECAAVSGTKPIEVPDGKKAYGKIMEVPVAISTSAGGASQIISGITAATEEKLVVENEKLKVETTQGSKELRYLPEIAKSIAEQTEKLSSVTGVKLVVEDDMPLYEVTGKKTDYFLWIFPVGEKTTSVKISAETGQVIKSITSR